MTIICDRQNFIDCVNGNLMVRNEKGIITHLGDKASEAVEATERGEEVILTVNNQRCSKIVNKQEIKF